MENDTNYGRILLLVFSGLTPIILAMLGMYLTWNLVSAFEHIVRSFVVLAVGILGFALGVLLFWRLAESLSLQEENK
jgi:predicted PurR-regulated permease PerM